MSAYQPIDVAAARPFDLAPRRAVRPSIVAAAVITMAAIVLRFGQFGNPLAGLDEQFYLLVGEAMWAGELPYVDIWDRKPVGLFLLFAGIAKLPVDGVLAAQLVATAFAAATGYLVALLAKRAVGWVPATMAAIFYIAGVNELWGETTQTPVFYNALTAASALLTLAAARDPRSTAGRRAALAAMAIAGLAIQIKTSAVFQGAFFGAWILFADWRRYRDPRTTLKSAIPLILLGAAPTLAAMALYLSLGEFGAWWQANVLSVLAKGMPTDEAAGRSFLETMVLFAPASLLALLGLWARTARFTIWTMETAFLLGWAAVSVADFVSIGGYYPHYTLPLLLACCPLIASAFALRRKIGAALFAFWIAWPLLHATVFTPRIAQVERGYAARTLTHLPADVRSRCVFIYEGPVAYHRLANACRVTRFPFSAHISSRREAPSLGVDPAVALGDAMANRPGVVLTVEHSTRPDRNLAMDALLAPMLARDYRLSARLPHRHYAPEERLLVWRRREPRSPLWIEP